MRGERKEVWPAVRGSVNALSMWGKEGEGDRPTVKTQLNHRAHLKMEETSCGIQYGADPASHAGRLERDGR